MGNPIAHSLSPRIHSLFAEQLQQAVHYQALLVPENDFTSALKQFFQAGGKGCNVTLPFKEQALSVADNVTERAHLAGAVNTLWQDKKGLIQGDSTDGVGLMNDLRNKNISIANKTVLIAGAGGVVKSVISHMLGAKPNSITIANRTVSRAQAIADNSDTPISSCAYEELVGKRFQVVCNATSAGLLIGDIPVPDGVLDEDAICYDMVYGEAARPFLEWADKNGAKFSSDGLGMLIEQAAESFYIWRGVKPETQSVLSALAKLG